MIAKSGSRSGFLSAFCTGAGCELKTGLTRYGFISLFYMDQKPDCKKADFLWDLKRILIRFFLIRLLFRNLFRFEKQIKITNKPLSDPEYILVKKKRILFRFKSEKKAEKGQKRNKTGLGPVLLLSFLFCRNPPPQVSWSIPLNQWEQDPSAHSAPLVLLSLNPGGGPLPSPQAKQGYFQTGIFKQGGGWELKNSLCRFRFRCRMRKPDY